MFVSVRLVGCSDYVVSVRGRLRECKDTEFVMAAVVGLFVDGSFC